MSKLQTGENNSNWNGGTTFFPYCPKFDEDLKEKVRTYFNRECYLCGKTEKDNKTKLSVHHANYDKMVCCNDIEPLFVPLCKSCHAKTHGKNGKNKEYWEEFFTISLKCLTKGKCFEKSI